MQADLFVYRLRSTKVFESCIDEVSVVVCEIYLMELCPIGTFEPCSFLYVQLTARHKFRTMTERSVGIQI